MSISVHRTIYNEPSVFGFFILFFIYVYGLPAASAIEVVVVVAAATHTTNERTHFHTQISKAEKKQARENWFATQRVRQRAERKRGRANEQMRQRGRVSSVMSNEYNRKSITCTIKFETKYSAIYFDM